MQFAALPVQLGNNGTSPAFFAVAFERNGYGEKVPRWRVLKRVNAKASGEK